jgi:hypothetical protein
MSLEDKVVYCENLYFVENNKTRCASHGAPYLCPRDGVYGVCCFQCNRLKKCISDGNPCGVVERNIARHGNIFKLMAFGKKIKVRRLFEDGAYKEKS